MKYVMVLGILSLIIGCSGGMDRSKAFSTSMKKYNAVRSGIKIGDAQDITIASLENVQKEIARFPEMKRDMESYNHDGKKIDIYYVRTNHYPDGLMTDDEFTPYVFVDSILTAIGWKDLGGSKTQHDPQRVRENQMMMMNMYMMQANQTQQLGQSMVQVGNDIRESTKTNLSNRPPQPVNTDLRNIHMDLQQLNQTLKTGK